MRPAGKTTRLRGIEASIEATLKLESAHNARRALCTKQLEQAEYEARRAFEQYDQVDARNRLVATELEARWSLSFSTLSMRLGRGLRTGFKRGIVTKLDDPANRPRADMRQL